MKKRNKFIRRVGLVANTDKSGARLLVKAAHRICQRQGLRVKCEAETGHFAGIPCPTSDDLKELANESDVIVVFGGDGTMLRVAREVAGCATPILGVNIGGLGFLTTVNSSALSKSLKDLFAGKFTIEERPLLEARGRAKGAALGQVAFNDFVVSRGILSRLIELDVFVDDSHLTRYRCDGLIVSSPTGSTAYSLAAGGAIVHPAAPVFTITPICPHTLSNRSVIVGMDAAIRIKVSSEKLDTVVSADGQMVGELGFGDEIAITRSARNIRLAQLTGTTFFETLRYKLKWSGSNL